VAPITSPPQIPIQPGPDFLTAWNAHWANGDSVLLNSTPTEKGLLAGEMALATPPPGNTVMILVTDGQPSCGMNESVIAERLLTKNIKTYVIGLPGSAGGVGILDQVAVAGGAITAGCTSNCFITPTDATTLEQALGTIATTVVTTTKVVTVENCSFTITAPDGGNVDDVHLIVTDATTGQDYEVPHDGWMVSSDHSMATLTGDVCDQAKGGAFISFSFQFGCVSVPILPTR
jgi:hypothetical protein